MITCQFENGDKAALRHITVGTIVVQTGRVLLAKRGTFHGKPILESGKWALLGGFMDRDENLENAARREVLEESGWKIDHLQLLRINDNPDRPKEDRQNVDFVFCADAAKEVSHPDEEVRELSWFELENVPPESEWAFDHYDDFMLYKKYLQKPFTLPVIG